MSTIRPVELDMIDLVFRGGERGYILDFSNRTFGEFFALELDADIDAEMYKREGTSKGKRLRAFLAIVDDGTAARTLRLLWEYRDAMLKMLGQDDAQSLAKKQIFAVVARLEGTATGIPSGLVPAPKLAIQDWAGLLTRLLSVRDLRPHDRGYAFEAYLKELFDAFGMAAREPFRLKGEQIDGSFCLAGETYLIEAKWLNRKVGVAELHAFHGKIDQKAAWARGVFVSFGGFSEQGLDAFGKGKRLVCMEGREIKIALEREVGIDALIAMKVRRAAETGSVFTRLESLIPL
jgi:Restriction endonuclease